MNSDKLCATIGQTLPPRFECSPAPQEGVRVRTPLMYPDGGIVDVFVLERSKLPVRLSIHLAVCMAELDSRSS